MMACGAWWRFGCAIWFDGELASAGGGARLCQSLPEQGRWIRLQDMEKTRLKTIRIATGMVVIAVICRLASAQMGEMTGMQHHHTHNGEKLGSVSFPVSCEPASKVPMERGVALLHSFGYDEAGQQF